MIAEVMRKKVAEVMWRLCIFSKVCLSKVYFCKMYPTCVSSKLCEFIAKLATRLRHLRCHIALDCPIGIISIELVSSSVRVTSVKFAQMCRTHSRTDIQTPGLTGSEKKKLLNVRFQRAHQAKPILARSKNSDTSRMEKFGETVCVQILVLNSSKIPCLASLVFCSHFLRSGHISRIKVKVAQNNIFI